MRQDCVCVGTISPQTRCFKVLSLKMLFCFVLLCIHVIAEIIYTLWFFTTVSEECLMQECLCIKSICLCVSEVLTVSVQ